MLTSDADHKAAEELALEHTDAVEAMRFLRGVSSLSLRECSEWVQRLARQHPASALALDVTRRREAGTTLFRKE